MYHTGVPKKYIHIIIRNINLVIDLHMLCYEDIHGGNFEHLY